MTTNDIMELAEARSTDWFLIDGTVRLNVDYFDYPVCPLGAAFHSSTAAALKAAGKHCELKSQPELQKMIAASDNEVTSIYFDPELRERMEHNCTKQFDIDFA